jgi:nicotinamide mononucleotide adenylyltransferase
MWQLAVGAITVLVLGVPFAKARRKLRKLEKDVLPLHKLKPMCDDADKPLLVLVGCGSYSPITNMHLRIFEQARNWLTYEKKTWDVVGGFLSPVHDAYGKAGLVPARHRIRMCELGSESSDWIAVTGWETRQDKWNRTVEVLAVYEKALNESKVYPKPVRVKLICGADLLESFTKKGLWQDADREIILGKFGVVCIERSGADRLDDLVARDPYLSPFADNIDLVPQRVSNTVSSTGIREHLSQNLSVKYLVPDQVIDYIYHNTLYGHTILQDKLVRKKSIPDSSLPTLHGS